MQTLVLVVNSEPTMADGRGALNVNAVAVSPEFVRTEWEGNDPPSRLANVELEVPDELDSVDITLRIKGGTPEEYPVGSKLRLTVEPAE